MLVWNNIKTVKDNNLFIRQIKYIGGHSPERGYIYFDNVEDTNDRIPSDGRIDLLYDAVYENKYEVGVYYVCDIINEKNNIYIPSLTNYKIIYYSDVDAVNNYLFLSEDVSSGFDEEGNKITSVTDTTLIEVNYTEIRCREKQQVRPSDESQEWTDTDVVRDKEDCDIIYDDCSCGRKYQWFRVGEICDNGNLCEKLKFQYQDECGYWKDYQPELYKIGDIIEMDSSLCGTYEYKEEWDEENEYCGSYINELYNLDKNSKLDEHNKYIIKYPYIKKYDEFVWQQLDCSTLLGYKVVKENSFECGWYGEKPEIIKNICGSNAKELYPTKLSGLTDTYKYNITLNGYYITAPYPTNTDDMSEDEWVWIENPSGFTSYSTSIVKRNDCDCGYYITDWTDTNEFICGNKLGDGYTPTTLYKKYRKDKYCDGEIIEEGTEYKYESYHSNDCECGYYTTKWDKIDEFICGSELNNNNVTLTINSVDGSWLRNGNTFTSNTISSNGSTVQKITFTVSDACNLTLSYDVSSESGYDKFAYTEVDGTSFRGDISGSKVGTVSLSCGSGQHTIQLKYYKDGSNSSGRDNVIVTLGVNQEYTNTTKYQKEIEQKVCGGEVIGTTGNERWVEYEKNSYDCGFKRDRWVEVDEDGDGKRDKMCCGDNGEYFDITRIEGLGSGEGYWYESNGNYRLHLLSATGSSQPLKIYFKTNSGVKINLKKNSSSSNLKWWYSKDIDSEDKAYLTDTSFEKTYGVGSEWDDNEHYIFVYAEYLNSSVLNYEVQATFEIGLPCTPFTSYVKLKHQYTEDGTNYKDYEPKEYKYGNIIMSNDPDCGYMPLIDQWVEICKDCTYEDVVTNGVINSDCARCYSFEGSVSGLYSLQKRQISKDLGVTWEDTMPLETNKFRFLKLGDVCE